MQKTACYNCGASNPDGLSACAKCGSPLSAATTERGSSKSTAVVLGLVVVVVAAVGFIAAQVG